MDKFQEEISHAINDLFVHLAMQLNDLVEDILVDGTAKDKKDLRKLLADAIERLDKGLVQ